MTFGQFSVAKAKFTSNIQIRGVLKVMAHKPVYLGIQEVCVLFHYTPGAFHSYFTHMDLYDRFINIGGHGLKRQRGFSHRLSRLRNQYSHLLPPEAIQGWDSRLPMNTRIISPEVFTNDIS